MYSRNLRKFEEKNLFQPMVGKSGSRSWSGAELRTKMWSRIKNKNVELAYLTNLTNRPQCVSCDEQPRETPAVCWEQNCSIL